MKQKTKFTLTSTRYMVHGVELENISSYQQSFTEELKRIRRDF
jgi:hypothetical protein